MESLVEELITADPEDGKSLLTFPDPRALALSVRASALVFEDPASRALLGRIERVAPSEATVLIIGETGTGKELVARHVHKRSRRQHQKFVAINCAAFSESLAEGELFGYERGAFTWAVNTKAGWFEAAQGGTLFLDEIGDLPQGLQAKLLRVLQEREVVRLGSRQPIPINVRLIAATNVDLEEAVRARRFREDLYYRLKVVTLQVPPLRDRVEDILPLAHHFLKAYGARLGCTQAELSCEAASLLLHYPWPGNIRELENVIHNTLLVCQGCVIQPGDLHLSSLSPARDVTWAVNHSLEASLLALYDKRVPDLDPLYEFIDKTVIRTAFNYCERNQLQTARFLGISRNVLRARLIRYNLL